MGFSSLDDLIASLTAGKSYRADFNKTYTGGTVVAGRWYDLQFQPGTPANQVPGNLVRNWDFQGSANGWTLSANMTFTPATHLITKSGGAAETVTIPVQCTPGISYQVYCTFGTLTGSGNMSYNLGGTAGANITAAGTTVQDIVMGTSNSNLVITVPSGITATTIDQVVVIRKLQFHPHNQNCENALWHGGNAPNGETKHLINMGAWTQIAAGAPAVLMLVDILGCYPAIDTKVATRQDFITNLVSNGTFTGNITNWTAGSANWSANGDKARRAADADVSTLTQMMPTIIGCPYTVVYAISSRTGGGVTVSLGGTAGTLRTADGTYTETITPVNETGGLVFTPNVAAALDIDDVTVTPTIPRYADGAGVRMYLAMSKIDNGTGTPSFAVKYTNTAPVNDRNLGGAPAVLASAIQGHIYHSGVAASSMGPFLPLQAGDSGIISVQSIQMSAASGSQGYSTLVLCRPIASMPIMTAFVASERDFLNQLPSLPQIKDGACLGFLIFAGGVISNVTAYQGYLDVGWS